MNGALLLIPLVFIRYILLSLFGKRASARAAFFTLMQGLEKNMYWVYQGSTLGIIIYLFFLKVRTDTVVFYIGLVIYGISILLFITSTIHFAKPNETGMNQRGIYRFSRNPMYVAYFLYFISCAMLRHSIVLLCIVLVFGISSHWIVLSEERWCIEQFGDEYKNYMKKVRRYI